jgi:hypothetical protein
MKKMITVFLGFLVLNFVLGTANSAHSFGKEGVCERFEYDL